jgi:hypothetical protein
MRTLTPEEMKQVSGGVLPLSPGEPPLPPSKVFLLVLRTDTGEFRFAAFTKQGLPFLAKGERLR